MKSGVLLVLSVIVLAGCGPSPAMEPRTPARAVTCPCEDDDDDDIAQPAARRSVEYVRLDEWEPPPAVKDVEARIEPRGDKPPEYVDLPRLTMHREIAPSTIYRRGSYWWR